MRRALLFIVILSLSDKVCPQDISVEANEENYIHFMDLPHPSEEQIDSMIQLSISYSYLSRDSCLTLGARAVDSAQESGYIFGQGIGLLELGDSYRIFGDLDVAHHMLMKGKEIFRELDDDEHIAYAHLKLGSYFIRTGDKNTSLEYYLKSLNTWEELEDRGNTLKAYINIATIMYDEQPYLAIDYNHRALEIAEELGDEKAITYISNNVAVIYQDFANEYQNVLDTAKVNVKLYKDSADQAMNKALLNFNRALVLARKRDDLISVSRALNNICNLKIKQGKLKEALDILAEVEPLTKSLGESNQITIYHIQMARVQSRMGNHQKAVEHGEVALKNTRKNSNEESEMQTQIELYPSYKALGMTEKALNSLEVWKAFNDKYGTIEIKKSLADLEALYQNTQKKKQILEQKNELMVLEANKTMIEKQRNSIIGGGLILSLLLFFGLKINRIRKQRNDKIAFAEALIFAQEEERKRIAGDLHDGVGQSLLLIKKQMTATNTSVEENQKLINETLEEVRSISRDLHPFQLQKFGLTAAIEGTIDKVSNSTNIFMTRDIANIDNLFTNKGEIHLYRAIQEALSNIVKHAKASAAMVSISLQDKHVDIQIKDNGIGFDVEKKEKTFNSLGLKTMSERILALGGAFVIEKGIPKGTSVRIRLPIGS